MLFIFAAHYGEVENIIQALKMGKRKTSFPFLQYCTSEFSESEGRILLTICGEGRNNAAAAVSATLAKEGAKRGDILLSLGSAAILKAPHTAGGSCLGSWFLIHALQEWATGRQFYPDMLYSFSFPEARLITGDKLLSWKDAEILGRGLPYLPDRGELKASPANASKKRTKGSSIKFSKEIPYPEEIFLYDMESTAVFQSGYSFLSTEDMFFLRCGTDFGLNFAGNTAEESAKEQSKNQINKVKEEFRKLLKREEEQVLSFIRILDEISLKKEKERQKEEAFLSEVQLLSQELRLSFVLEKKLEKLLRYGKSIHFSWNKYFQKKRQEGFLPVRDKRGGQKILQELEDDLLHFSSATEEGLPCLLETKKEVEDRGGEEREIPYAISKEEDPLSFHPHFSHIYVEREIWGHADVETILKKFPKAKIILIRHYKDLFNRKKQSRFMQERSKKLILAKKEGQRIYPGAPVCQSFSETQFCYSSLIMNCPFHCEYCYLQGMYPSANLVLFLNIEDYFQDCRKWIREKGSLYLCISYDTDLLALEEIFPYVEKFSRFLEGEEKLRIEVRTKAGGEALFRKIKRAQLSAEARKRLIFAFTVSPEEIVQRAEHSSASLESRLRAAKLLIEEGYSIRLCFDPMIYHEKWKELYNVFLDTVFREISMAKLYDCSVGSFRISETYLKPMLKAFPQSPYTVFPYENTGGYYHYPEKIKEEMEGFLLHKLEENMPREKIFRWSEDVEVNHEQEQ